MAKKIKIDDKVSFSFAGSKLEGIVIELYTKSNKKKAKVQGTNDGRGYKYPVDIESLTKL